MLISVNQESRSIRYLVTTSSCPLLFMTYTHYIHPHPQCPGPILPTPTLSIFGYRSYSTLYTLDRSLLFLRCREQTYLEFMRALSDATQLHYTVTQYHHSLPCIRDGVLLGFRCWMPSVKCTPCTVWLQSSCNLLSAQIRLC